MKDKEWLEGYARRKYEKYKLFAANNVGNNDRILDQADVWGDIIIKIREMDEPEITEEQAWQKIASIHKHDSMYWEYAKEDFMKGRDGVVIEKTEIPQFVADFIVNMRKGNHELRHILNNVQHNYTWDYMHEIDEWVINNEKKFVEAWYYGYTIKEESKYEVRLPTTDNDRYSLMDCNGDIWQDSYPHNKYQLTEQEINDIDPRYMKFAEKVDSHNE